MQCRVFRLSCNWRGVRHGAPKAARDWAPALAPYRRASAARGLFELAVTFLPFVALWAAMLIAARHGQVWLSLAMAPLAAFLLVRLFMIRRDCGHGSFLPSKAANEWIGRAIGVVNALLFLVSSRYCDSDKLADFAWSRFGKLSGGTRVVQAICDFVHAKIRFNYADARSTRCASDSMHEGIGVCRDFAHLAIALCRCMNIPARYCTGYLGDMIGRATMRNGARPTFQMRRLAASRMPALVVIVLTHGMAPLRIKPKGKRLSIRNR